MKKNYPPPQLYKLIWRLGGALLLLVILFVVHSCRKNTPLTRDELNAQAAVNFPVNEAKDWFGRNKTLLATQVKVNSDASVLNMLADFTPDWDHARTAVDTNYYVVEAPAIYAYTLGFSTDSGKANINGLTRLLVLKDKKYGTLRAVLMHIHGDPHVQIYDVHYMAVPQAFSGNIFYTTLQGAFVCGFIYKEGKVTMRSRGGGSAPKPGGLQIMMRDTPEPNTCEWVPTDWWGRWCTDMTNESTCGDWFYMYSGYQEYCPEGGGDEIPPPECPPGYHQEAARGISVQTIGARRLITFDAGQTISCVPDLKISKDSLTKYFPCASALIIDKLMTNPAYTDLTNVFTNNSKPDLSWQKGDSLPWNVSNTNGGHTFQLGATNSSGRNSIISLNTQMLQNSSQLLIAAAAIHETLHAYINYNIQTAVGNFLPPSDYNPDGSWAYSLEIWATINGLPSNYSNHYLMLDDYFDKAVNILATWDNNPNPTAADKKKYQMAMLFGLNNGIDGTPAQQTLLLNEYNSIMARYSINSTDLDTFTSNNLNSNSNKLPTSGCN